MKNLNNYNITKIFKLENDTENRTLKVIQNMIMITTFILSDIYHF